MLGLSGEAGRTDVHVIATVALIALINGVALVLKDLGLVVAFGGAILGSALVYIMPGLMFLGHAASKRLNGWTPTSAEKAELIASRLLIALGALLAVCGGTMSLKSAFAH